MRTKIDIHFAVDIPRAQVFEALAAIDMLPEWSMYRDARIATRDENGRPRRVYVTADVLGSSDIQVLEYEWTADRVTWNVVDSSRGIGGGIWFDVADGPAETKVRYHAEIHSRIPLPGLVMKRTMQRYHEAMVQNFIEFAESYAEPRDYRAL
ncbi:SRPBCC family protein [Nocardia arizonensis]|uniref:SRPBCC family protein n=1 Tax=Nocardia arizonensis TaxID=1141647 RepID=UPI0006D0BECA|nr:SRPBCC family protein [Nocardia arizonensis]